MMLHAGTPSNAQKQKGLPRGDAKPSILSTIHNAAQTGSSAVQRVAGTGAQSTSGVAARHHSPGQARRSGVDVIDGVACVH